MLTHLLLSLFSLLYMPQVRLPGPGGQPPAATGFSIGWDFRALNSSPWIGDYAPYVAQLGAGWSSGTGYGWVTTLGSATASNLTSSSRDRLSTNDVRLMGAIVITNSTSNAAIFRVDGLTAGTPYNTFVALGDASNSQNGQYMEVYADATTLLTTLGPTNTGGANYFVDSSNTVDTISAWQSAGYNRSISVTPTGTSLWFRFGHTATTGATCVANLRLSQ